MDRERERLGQAQIDITGYFKGAAGGIFSDCLSHKFPIGLYWGCARLAPGTSCSHLRTTLVDFQAQPGSCMYFNFLVRDIVRASTIESSQLAIRH
jgi:hypothetical protein